MNQSKVRDEKPVRLFKSDFLEFFTHISPLVVLMVWLPAIAYFLWRGFNMRPVSGAWLQIPLGFVLGLIIWTPSEYLLHRFVFHFHPKNPTERMKRLLFLVHGIHHAQPRSKTRLVMPPALSIPLSAVFYGIFYAVGALLLNAPQWVSPIFAGFLAGYVAYDMTHYSIHHFSMKKGVFKVIRQHHMAHHFKTPDKRFGVSSPVWDYVFRTNPAE